MDGARAAPWGVRIALAFLGLLVLLAVSADFVAAHVAGFSFDQTDPAIAYAAPGTEARPALTAARSMPARVHFLGTDGLGRDLLVRTIYALRVSLLVALAATVLSLLLGGALGLASGFIGGWTDRAFLRGLEVLQAIPLVFVVILVAVFSRDLFGAAGLAPGKAALVQSVVLALSLGAIQWFSLARFARGLSVSIRHADFVRGLEGMGFSTFRIVWRHLLPNAAIPLLAYAVLLVPTLVLEEAFLSFLGFGVQPPYPSLGILLNEGAAAMEISPVMLLLPAVLVFLLTLALNTVGEFLTRTLGLTQARGSD